MDIFLYLPGPKAQYVLHDCYQYGDGKLWYTAYTSLPNGRYVYQTHYYLLAPTDLYYFEAIFDDEFDLFLNYNRTEVFVRPAVL